MKISKGSNGAYVLRVSQIEATIGGPQSIKEVYELYEKLIRLVGDGQELKKIEPAQPKATYGGFVPSDLKPKDVPPEPVVAAVPLSTTLERPAPSDDPIWEVAEEIKFDELNRSEAIEAVLKKYGPLKVSQIKEHLPNEDLRALHNAAGTAFKNKLLKRKKDKADGVFVYALKEKASS